MPHPSRRLLPRSGRPRRLVCPLVVLAVGLLVSCGVIDTADDDTRRAGPDAGQEAGPAPTVSVPSGEQAEVLRVVDGDTFEVRIDGGEERVRLLGINTPEHDECWFTEAVDGLDELLAGGEVTLVASDRDRDQFGRLLRYAFAEQVFVDAEQARRGNAVATNESGDLQDDVLAAERQAQDAARGLWAPDACGEGAEGAGDVTIVEVVADPPGPDEEDPNGELVVVANEGPNVVDLGGWTLQDTSSRHRFTFPDGTTLVAGGEVVVRSGCGEAGGDELFWCAEGPVWSNGGDTAFLRDPSGNTVSSVPV